MKTYQENAPIIVGVGQSQSNWDGQDCATAPSPVSLACAAARSAIEDLKLPLACDDLIDTVVFVRTMLDSVPGARQPFGRCSNPPQTVAKDLGLAPTLAIYSKVGGDQPQALVNEFAERVFLGERKAVLICGAEATAAMKAALRNRVPLDWSAFAPGEMEDRGLGETLLSDAEMRSGLGPPTQTYPIFENAIRARLGLSREEYLQRISTLWESFSKVAASHPYAQFPDARTAEYLASPSKENFPVATPYLKWHVAQESVNQGAALILTTVGTALEAGIPEEKWTYVHGYAQASDLLVTERPDLSRSRAMSAVLQQTLVSSNAVADQIAHFDIYSCFPCVVQIAAEELGIDWRKQILTVTGGLPFFGGPGNNYSTHAIATMIELLRKEPGKRGLVMANGGFMSKFAAGVYSTEAPQDWLPISSEAIQKDIVEGPRAKVVDQQTGGEIVGYSVSSGRHGPTRGCVVVNGEEGRTLARIPSGHRATLEAMLNGPDPIGQTIDVYHKAKRCFVSSPHAIGSETQASEFLHRSFDFVQAERKGHVLEITLNRPETYNALHSAAHFELHEIFDEFERDRDLWVAIITGAGDKAFCSGNDLKSTAKGGDMSLPRSGFGGLCERYDREKPVIAAVNGVAMGGGLEIALACDMVVMDKRAKCALPEVKVGLFAAAGGIQRLAKQIGYKAATELILTGRHISAESAKELGIVNKLAEPGKALDGARELAEEILAVSPTAVRASMKTLNNLQECERLKDAIDANMPIGRELLRSNDFKEGVAAFAEKRAPKWTNS